MQGKKRQKGADSFSSIVPKWYSEGNKKQRDHLFLCIKKLQNTGNFQKKASLIPLPLQNLHVSMHAHMQMRMCTNMQR